MEYKRYDSNIILFFIITISIVIISAVVYRYQIMKTMKHAAVVKTLIMGAIMMKIPSYFQQ